MNDSRSSKSRSVSLDAFAKFLATGSLDRQAMEDGYRTLRATMSRRHGIPASETEELASQVVVEYLAEIKKDPTNLDKQTGAYMAGIAKHRCNDTYRRRRRQPEMVEITEENLSGHQFFEACRSAQNDREAALILSLHSGSVLRGHARQDSRLLKGGAMERIAEVIQLVASTSASADSVFPTARAILIEEGVLGGNSTRRLQARFDRQEARREFSSAAGPKSAGTPDPRGEPRLASGAKPDPSADD